MGNSGTCNRTGRTNSNKLDLESQKIITSVTPSLADYKQATNSLQGSNGVYAKSVDLPNKAKIKALLSDPTSSTSLKTGLQSIVTTLSVSVSEKQPTQNTALIKISPLSTGSHYVTASYTGSDYLGISVFEYTVGQTFYYDGTNVTYVSAASNNPQVWLGWVVSNVSNSISSPIPYSIATSENDAVFTGTIPVIGFPLSTAHVFFNFQMYGNGNYHVTPNIY